MGLDRGAATRGATTTSGRSTSATGPTPAAALGLGPSAATARVRAAGLRRIV